MIKGLHDYIIKVLYTVLYIKVQKVQQKEFCGIGFFHPQFDNTHYNKSCFDPGYFL